MAFDRSVPTATHTVAETQATEFKDTVGTLRAPDSLSMATGVDQTHRPPTRRPTTATPRCSRLAPTATHSVLEGQVRALSERMVLGSKTRTGDQVEPAVLD